METHEDQDMDEPESLHSSSSSLFSHGEREQPLPNKVKYLTAAAIFYSNVVFGCAFNTYGPVITTLQHKYETDDATITKVFTIMTACNMLGALSAGFIYNRVNRQLAVIIILTTMTAVMYITPHCPSMTLFFVTAGILGLAAGSYDTAQFVWMMEMMQKDCPPYIQSQHFFYALGTNFPGWIMAPFLDKNNDDGKNTTTMSYLIAGDATVSGFTNDTSVSGTITKIENTEDGSKLVIPYSIIGGVATIAVIAHATLFIFCRYHPPPPETATIEDESEQPLVHDEVAEIRIAGDTSWSLPKLRMVILCASFYAAYMAMEMTTFQLLPKFGQNSDLHLSESMSTYVLTGMTAAFTVGRGVSIIAIFKIPAQLILCANLLLALIANILLVGWASKSLTVFWICSVMFGLGYSSTYPSFTAFAERYLNFTNSITSLILVFGYGVAAMYPLVVGIFIENNPIVLSYVIFLSITIIVFSVSTLFYLTHKDKTRY